MSKNFRINLDLKRPECTPLSGFKQGDNLATISGIVLQDSIPYNLTNLTLRANFKLPDGTVKYQNVTLTNAIAGEFSLIVLSSILEKTGIVLADISVFNADKKITSSTFKMTVAESIYNDGAIAGENGKDLLEQILENEADRVNAEKTRKANEIVRIENENIRKANEIVREDNESKRKTGYSKMDTRIDNLVLGQGSATEVIDARLDGISNIKYPTLKARLDDTSNQLTQNSLATLTTSTPVTSLDNATDGLMQVDSIKGRTRYKKADGNYADVWEKGASVESAGENEANKIEILSQGNNLIDVNKIIEVVGDKSLCDYIDIDGKKCIFLKGSAKYNGKVIASGFKQDTQYLLKHDYKYAGKVGGVIRFKYTDGTFSGGTPTDSWETFYQISTKSKSVESITIEAKSDGTTYFDSKKIMLIEATKDEKYVPYQSDKIAIQLKEPLRSVGNAKDIINVASSQLITVTKKTLLSPELGWSEGDASLPLTIRFSATLKGAKNSATVVSNYPSTGKTTSGIDEETIQIASEYILMRILKTKLSTPDLAGFKKWLSQNSTEIIYELAEPIITTINLSSLKSFKDGRIVLNNAIPPIVDLKYPTSISGRLSSVENTVDDTVDRTQKLEEGLFTTVAQTIDNKKDIGTLGVEVSKARNGKPDLKAEIDTIKTSVTTKADKDGATLTNLIATGLINGSYSKKTDGNGAALFDKNNCMIILYAIDLGSPANYIFAMGYKDSGLAPKLNTISNKELTIGNANAQGTQIILGGKPEYIVCYGVSIQL